MSVVQSDTTAGAHYADAANHNGYNLQVTGNIRAGTALKHTGRLQRVHHALARVVVNKRSCTQFSSNELLKQLNWLPLEWRIQFKLASHLNLQGIAYWSSAISY